MILLDGKESRPISFVDQLVTSILADQKTETRRIVQRVNHQKPINAYLKELNSPYGKAGDLLWCRERFACFTESTLAGPKMLPRLVPSKIKSADWAVFRDMNAKCVDGNIVTLDELPSDVKWRPPMHMPFWAHRIVLEVTSIEIERLHEITEAGSIAEGLETDQYLEFREQALACAPGGSSIGTVRDEFIRKWDQINGKRIDKTSGKPMTWELNPFVWCIKFKRIKP